MVLIPYNSEEGITTEDAAHLASVSARTIRSWVNKYKIGRQVGGSKRAYRISRPALQMVLDRDWPALSAYLKGARREEIVACYFRRVGLDQLLEGPLFDAS